MPSEGLKNWTITEMKHRVLELPTCLAGNWDEGSGWRRGMACGDRRRVADGTQVFTMMFASNSPFRIF